MTRLQPCPMQIKTTKIDWQPLTNTMNTSATQLHVDIKHHLQIIMTKVILLAPRVTRLIMSPNIMIRRGFIKHRTSENFPSTMHNSPAKFQ